MTPGAVVPVKRCGLQVFRLAKFALIFAGPLDIEEFPEMVWMVH